MQAEPIQEVSGARPKDGAVTVVGLHYGKLTLAVAAGVLLAGAISGLAYAGLQELAARQRAKELERLDELKAQGAWEDPREYDLAKHSVLIRARTPKEAAEKFCAPKPLSQRDACLERIESRIKEDLGR